MSTANVGAPGEHHHAHHFESEEHQYLTAKQGIWAFLCTEIVMFGGLFVAYTIFHHLYPDVFRAGAKHLDWRLGALNTVVLLFSSLTMALGIHYVQVQQRSKALASLWITVVCGAIFMVVKYFEYTHKFHLGIKPGELFTGSLEGFKALPLYFSLYFMMTGLHGIHVMIGMGLIIWVARKTARGDFSPKYYTPLEGVGLFWHLVDLVWIYLFPLLYLVG